MNSRLNLHKILEGILKEKNVYFQPPSTINMSYPAIVYSRSNIENNFSNNTIYNQKLSYKIIVIDKNPDSEIVLKISQLSQCKHVSHYTVNNLNHDVFTLFY